MTHVRYDKSHPAGSGLEQRIASKLKNSGDAKHADVTVQKGTGPTRVFHNIHGSASHVKPRDVRKDQA